MILGLGAPDLNEWIRDLWAHGLTALDQARPDGSEASAPVGNAVSSTERGATTSQVEQPLRRGARAGGGRAGS